jgi:hypothetical protein
MADDPADFSLTQAPPASTAAGWGGRRPGAGRPRKEVAPPPETALSYAFNVLRDPTAGTSRRDAMCIALLAAGVLGNGPPEGGRDD